MVIHGPSQSAATAALSFFLLFHVAVFPHAIAAAQTPLSGWAWSDTIGWISLACTNVEGECDRVPYGLSRSANRITGWAWSDNIGWISANPADLAGCPHGECSVAVSTAGTLSGWMRAINATTGWDGWISLSDTGHQSTFTGTGIKGWAWGDAVIGWVLFSAEEPCAPASGRYCDGTFLRERTPACEVITISDCGASGCSTVTNRCIVPPPPSSRLAGNLMANPRLVQPGGQTILTWDVANADSCSVSGNGDSWFALSASVPTNNPIMATTRYSLECSGAGGAFAATVDVRTVPRIREF